MIVKSAPGTQCPMEANPKTYVTDSEPIDVPDTAYYRRLLDDGSLVEAKLDEGSVAEAKPGKKSTGGDQ
jgi:hypothetical protein